MCTSLVIGNMIGSGVFLLPASLAPYGGISIIAWGITAIGATFLALVFARLSRMVPKAGGPYAYTRRGFGDFAGFLVAWGYWISILATNAAISVAFVSYLTVFWPALAENSLLAVIVALGTIWFLSGVNAMGVRSGGLVQLITTILKLIPLIAIATLGLLYFNVDNFTPFNASGQAPMSAVTATVALTLWAFLGLESATIPADGVVNPERTISRATLIGTFLTAAVYVLGTVAVMGIIARDGLAASTAPFADGASKIWGAWAGYAVGLGAVISCFGALNGWILLQGQIPLASARDNLFPAFFKRVSKNGTPVAGIVFSSVLVTVLMAMNYAKGLVELFTFIILLATLTCLVPYVFSSMALLMIFIKDRDKLSGQRLVGSSVIAVLAFLYSAWAIGGSGRDTVYWGFLLLVAGIPVYVWIRWRHSRADVKGIDRYSTECTES
jgi:APA family basic amino acid/polyamine antiporter